jgi:integral membrane sensor domain MASE1
VSTTRLSIASGSLRITAPPLWLAAALPLAFFAAAVASQAVFGTDDAIWVSNAFVVTAMLRNNRSTWPVLILLVAVVDTVANGVAGQSFIIGFWMAAVDCGEVLVITGLVHAASIASLDTIKSMAKLSLICLLVPVMSAAACASLLAFYFGTRFWVGWRTWDLATAFGLLMVTPLLLSWTDPAIRTQNLLKRVVQANVLAGHIADVGYLDLHDTLPGLLLAFPVLLVATFNGALLGATTGAVALAVVIWSTMTGSGDFAAFAKIRYGAKSSASAIVYRHHSALSFVGWRYSGTAAGEDTGGSGRSPRQIEVRGGDEPRDPYPHDRCPWNDGFAHEP